MGKSWLCQGNAVEGIEQAKEKLVEPPGVEPGTS